MGRATSTPLSPTALNRHLGCEHRTWLDLLERRGEPVDDRRPPDLELLQEQGQRHEDEVLRRLRADGAEVVSFADDEASYAERAARTREALASGVAVVHQGCLLGDGWVGFPDLLIRVGGDSDLGPFHFEAHDVKLGGHVKPSHVFQLLHYTDALAAVQGRRPARMHVVLGDGRTETLRPEDLDAYARRIREAFGERYAELLEEDDDASVAYPWPVEACGFCPWWHHCDDRRRTDDHLSLVANLGRSQGRKLEAAGITTLTGLATLPAEETVPGLALDTLVGLREQARLQLEARTAGTIPYELLEPQHGRGLHRLPAPSAGDVFFDFEGDPYWGEDGLEFLFGTVFDDGAGPVYDARWATDRREEKAAFEGWMDWLGERLARFPALHVFHYNSYEPTALKRLAARHATREQELDDLLRRKVFVDLYGVVRQALRAGVESYGLKAIEPLVGFERDPGTALGALRRWQAFLADRDPAHLDAIAAYNEADCRATAAVSGWLLDRREEAERRFDVEIDALEPEPEGELTDRVALYLRQVEELRPLLDGLPDDESADTEEERHRRLAFHLHGYHRRELLPQYWDLFARRDRSPDALRDEDPEAIGHLRPLLPAETVARSWQWTLEYPEQDTKLGPGSADDPVAERPVTVVSIDEATRTVVVKVAKRQGDEPPTALGPDWPITCDPQQDALHRFGLRVLADGAGRCGHLDAGADLLTRRAPAFRPGTPALTGGDVALGTLKAQVRGLDDSALVIQGPPGSGKTWTGARLALDLMSRGHTVGVVATAHKAINNFLRAVDDAADETGTRFRGWKKASGGDKDYRSARVHCRTVPDESEGPVRLRAATAWYWSHQDAETVDVLFVDEAGQVSLADAIAVSQGARSVVLLGDPQQLPHVSQGTHVLGSGASVLEHLLGEDATVPPDRGVLLNRTWRMHPEITGFLSTAMYDGRLSAVDGCDGQRIDAPGLSGAGLRLLAVDHEGNRGRSVEEADRVAGEFHRLLGARWTDRAGVEREIGLDDVLVVAPYNAQVRCIAARLPDGARVGTVDKFQGQEAPVVLFSMATSSGEDASRGLAFVFSRNRLNVAVSRAQALAVVVCSPRLFTARCQTVEDMRLVDLLCRFADAASPSG